MRDCKSAAGSGPTIGVLALQGDFDKHKVALEKVGATVCLVRDAKTLQGVDALVLPGGESTSLLKLLDEELRQTLSDRLLSGMPALATCAGLILLATEVSNPQQFCFGLIDIKVSRNGYGRQVDSFVSSDLALTERGKMLLTNDVSETPNFRLSGIFIRAPRITAVGSQTDVLACLGHEPVLVRQGNIIGATFHPELCHEASPIHMALLKIARVNASA